MPAIRTLEKAIAVHVKRESRFPPLRMKSVTALSADISIFWNGYAHYDEYQYREKDYRNRDEIPRNFKTVISDMRLTSGQQ